MEKPKTANRYSAEVASRAVRMVSDCGADHASKRAALASIAAEIGCTPETLLAGFDGPSATTACDPTQLSGDI